jgi:hypothetical protein
MEESTGAAKRLRRSQARLLEPLPPTPPQTSKTGDDTAPTQRAPQSDSDDDDVCDHTVPYNDDDVHRRITPWPVHIFWDENIKRVVEKLMVPHAVKLNSKTHLDQLVHYQLHPKDHPVHGLFDPDLVAKVREESAAQLELLASLFDDPRELGKTCARATTAMSTSRATGSPATPPPRRNLSSGSASPAATASALASDGAASACPPQTTSTTETATPATTIRATCDSCPAASTAADDDAQP